MRKAMEIIRVHTDAGHFLCGMHFCATFCRRLTNMIQKNRNTPIQAYLLNVVLPHPSLGKTQGFSRTLEEIKGLFKDFSRLQTLKNEKVFGSFFFLEKKFEHFMNILMANYLTRFNNNSFHREVMYSNKTFCQISTDTVRTYFVTA